MKIGSIIFVLMLIFANVIAPLLKKHSEEKARKQRQQGSDQPGRPAQRSATTGPSTTGQSRLERLAARRMAQLEELRGRREQRRSATSTPQARIGPAPTPTPTSRPTQFRAPAPQPTRQVSRQASTRPSVSLPSATRQPRPQPVQRRRVSKQPTAQPVERKGLGALHAAPITPTPTKATHRPFLSLDAQNITPQLLRRLVVLKEIFDPPIALRTRDIWDRPG